jgi:hypothetical protein
MDDSASAGFSGDGILQISGGRGLVHFSSKVVGESSVIAARKPLSDEHFKMCRTAAICAGTRYVPSESLDRSSLVHREILVMHAVPFTVPMIRRQ